MNKRSITYRIWLKTIAIRNNQYSEIIVRFFNQHTMEFSSALNGKAAVTRLKSSVKRYSSD